VHAAGAEEDFEQRAAGAAHAARDRVGDAAERGRGVGARAERRQRSGGGTGFGVTSGALAKGGHGEGAALKSNAAVAVASHLEK
jgi:hypothetical protein